jgi:hypothetical protein
VIPEKGAEKKIQMKIVGFETVFYNCIPKCHQQEKWQCQFSNYKENCPPVVQERTGEHSGKQTEKSILVVHYSTV